MRTLVASATLTATLSVAVRPSAVAVTVMVVEPGVAPTTSPVGDTLATSGLDEV